MSAIRGYDARIARATIQDRWIAVGLGLIAGLLFWAHRTLEQSGDSLAYAMSVRTGIDLFHPHHLIFAPVVKALVWLTGAVVPSPDIVDVAQVHNVVWAAVAVAAVYLTMTKLVSGRMWAILSALTLVVSNGLFVYATEAEVYVPAMGCLAMVTLIVAVGLKSGWTVRRLLWLSLWFALAVLYHQSSVLLVVPLVVALRFGNGVTLARRLAIAVGVSGLLVVAGYLVGYANSAESMSLGGFRVYCLEYALRLNPAWGSLSHFSVSGIALLLKSQLRNLVWLPAGSSKPVLALIGLFGLALAGLVLLGVRRVAHRESFPLRLFLIGWLIVHFAFFLWWLPGEDEFFITSLVPLIMLCSLTLRGLFRKFKKLPPWLPGGVAVVLIVVLLSVNLAYSIFPRIRSRGPAYEQAAELAAMADRECTLVTDDTIRQHLRYYFDREYTREGVQMLLYAYYRGEIPDSLVPEQGRPVLIAAEMVAPDYGGAGIDGVHDPDGWWLFLATLFEVSNREDSVGVMARSFEVREAGDGVPNLWLSGERQAYGSEDQILNELDARLSAATGAEWHRFAAVRKAARAEVDAGE